jgi:hypothetical protein
MESPATLGHSVSFLPPAVLVILVNVSSIGTTSPDGKTSTWVLPDKTLYNIGLDAATTDLVLLTPPGARLSKHPILLDESSMLGRALQVADALEIVAQHARQTRLRDAEEEKLSPAFVLPVLSSKMFKRDPYPYFHTSEQDHPEHCGAEQPASMQMEFDSLEIGKLPTFAFNSHVSCALMLQRSHQSY